MIRGGGCTSTVVLLHDAVLETAETVRGHLGLAPSTFLPIKVVAILKDAKRRSVADRWPTIDYRQAIELVADADRVVSW